MQRNFPVCFEKYSDLFVKRNQTITARETGEDDTDVVNLYNTGRNCFLPLRFPCGQLTYSESWIFFWSFSLLCAYKYIQMAERNAWSFLGYLGRPFPKCCFAWKIHKTAWIARKTLASYNLNKKCSKLFRIFFCKLFTKHKESDFFLKQS